MVFEHIYIYTPITHNLVCSDERLAPETSVLNLTLCRKALLFNYPPMFFTPVFTKINMITSEGKYTDTTLLKLKVKPCIPVTFRRSPFSLKMFKKVALRPADT